MQKLTLAVGKADSQSLGLGLALADIGGGVPDPAAVTADVGAQLHVGDDWNSVSKMSLKVIHGIQLTVVVGADLEGLIPAHDQAGLLVLLVLQETDVTSTTLLPLLALTVELEQLGAHLEHLLLELLVGLGLNLLGQADDGLEVDIGGFGGLVLGVLIR